MAEQKEAVKVEETPTEEVFDGLEIPELEEKAADEAVNTEVIDELVDKAPEKKAEDKPEPPEEKAPTEAELNALALKDTDEVDPQVAGLIRDIQGERTKRQALEEENARLKAGHESKPETRLPETVQELIDTEELDPDDAVTAATWAKLDANKAENAKQHTEQVAAKATVIMQQYDEQAKEKYSVEKVGKGKDYDYVVRTGRNLLTAEDEKELGTLILKGGNTPELLYERCKQRLAESHPALKDFYKPASKKAAEKPAAEPKVKDHPIPSEAASEELTAAQNEEAAFEADVAKTEEQLDKEILELSRATG